jgi:O-antigen ligase
LKAPLGLALAAALIGAALVDWTQRSWRIAVAIAALSLVAVLWALVTRQIRWPLQMLIVAPLSLWGAAQLLAHASVVPYRTQHDAVMWALCGVAFLLGSQILSDRSARHAFLNVLMWGGTGLAGLAILQFYSDPLRVYWVFPVIGGGMGTFHYRNQFAAFMELTAAISLWRILVGNPVSGAISFAVMFAATLTSESRSGLLLMTVELVAFLLLAAFSRRTGSQSVLRAGILILFAAGAILVAGIQPTLERLEQSTTADARLTFSRSTIQMIKERPWSGFGMGTWPMVYPRFATMDNGLIVNEAHDDWLQWASEGGIPFALLMVALVIWLAVPAVDSVWGIGLLIVMAHSAVDYLLRDPVLGFTWFAMAGALAVWRRDS